MKKYSKLKQEYDNLDEKYHRLVGEKEELSYELTELKASVEHVREQDEEIRKLHENIRRIKHDMKNHLMVIVSYLNSEDYVDAKEYTSQIMDKLNGIYSYIETGNTLLNHILNEKLNLAREKGISIKAEVENLSFGKMESLDFSAMLSNVLDNAIEACVVESEPELYVQIMKKRGYEMVLVKNRITNSVLAENPKLNSTKKETGCHGLGVQQIRAVTEKYQGMCDFYEEDGYFCSCIFIPA